MATYSAVVSLIQDLEQHRSSYELIFGSKQRFCPFIKKEIENLYNTVSLMDSFLRDSSGLSYDHQFMNPTLEKMIRDVVDKAGNYVDFWAVQCLQYAKWTGGRFMLEGDSLTYITQGIVSINKQLKRIRDERKDQDLEVTSSTAGNSSGFLSPLRRNPEKLVDSEKDLVMMLDNLTAENKSPETKMDLTATCNAVASLMEDLEQHLSSYDDKFYSDYGFHPFTKQEIEMLYDAVRSMDSFLRESSGQSYNHKLMDLISEGRILDLAYRAGALVDFLAVLCLAHTRFTTERIISGDPTLTQITEEIVYINEELKKIHDARNVQDLGANSSTGKSSTSLSPLRRTPNTEGKLVGLEKELVMMLDSLTGQPSQLKVFSIIGMAGIGKTTFSRKLFDNPLVVHHFYVRVWVTVSQQYQVKEMLLGVLRSITNFSDEIYGRSNEELREQVYRILKGKRYLIVLDDMWDTKAWDELKGTFPDDKNGSRIMLTSRLREVAVHASQDTPPHCLRCLSMHESWELLSSKIFVDESCPLELVEIGRQIAYKCQGLPLAIVVVGGLLSKMKKKLDIWEEVSQSVGSLLMEKAEDCKNVLALSYKHLPDHLKACFLYMGNFPEDYEISVKKLIWLWVAEGFIRPSSIMSLEEVAEGYLEDLTTRSLILVKRRSSDSKIKTCYIHDLMRELCLRQSHEQNFLRVINNCGQLPLKTQRLRYGIRQIPSNFHSLRRLSFHSSIREYIHRTSFPCTRSVMCFEKLSLSDRRIDLGMKFKLLRVLNIMNIRLRLIPIDISNLTLLKFMALTIEDPLYVKRLSRFLSLQTLIQTLIVDCQWNGRLPRIFWGMVELRHFHLKRSCLSYSPMSYLEPVDAQLPLGVLNNLRSVSTVRPISCTKKIFLSMPYLKKLGIYETEEDYRFRGWFKELVHLRELETLKYVFSNPFVSSVYKPDRLPSWDSFPPQLVKLTLSGTSLPWEDMLKLSMLPRLEVLKLRNYAFSGAVWKSTEGFRCLRFLLLGSTNLEVWEADATHFPNLQHLVLRHCRSLEEIPYGIGEAPLLEKIELHRCKESAVMSARHLQEEQQSLGNEGLTIYITEG